jgi:DNA-binding MarR family transcriptional regulator
LDWELVKRYRLADGVLRAELEGEAVLMNPDTGQYHLLNPTGVRVLDAIERNDDVSDAVSDLARRGGVSEATVDADVQAFVDALLERGLLTPVDR